MTAYYNEVDPYAAQWLRNLIDGGHIARGDVDERSIVDVRPDDLRGYTQSHFFAGIGGWSPALRLAGWPDDRPVWTGSCPCQPFSAAGAGKAGDDERHLWPAWFPLIAECAPPIVFGEQVEAAVGWGWLDLVFSDLEGKGYACGAAVLPACGVGAPHIRQRLWFVADAGCAQTWRNAGDGSPAQAQGDSQRLAHGHYASDTHGARSAIGNVAHAASRGFRELGDASQPRRGGHIDGGRLAGELGDAPRGEQWRARRCEPSERWTGEDRGSGAWRDCDWLPCTDGKSRPVEPGSFPLGHGIPNRTHKLRAYGNAIVPQAAAEFIRASM